MAGLVSPQKEQPLINQEAVKVCKSRMKEQERHAQEDLKAWKCRMKKVTNEIVSHRLYKATVRKHIWDTAISALKFLDSETSNWSMPPLCSEIAHTEGIDIAAVFFAA